MHCQSESKKSGKIHKVVLKKPGNQQQLTGRKSCLGNDSIQCIVNQFVIHKEPEIPVNRGLPFGDGPLLWLLSLLLAFFGLIPGVQFHGHEPHLLHKPFGLTRVPLLRLLGRGGRDQGEGLHPNSGNPSRVPKADGRGRPFGEEIGLQIGAGARKGSGCHRSGRPEMDFIEERLWGRNWVEGSHRNVEVEETEYWVLVDWRV